MVFESEFIYFCPSAAVWAFYDPYFQCEKGWRSNNHRAFKCTAEDNKKVSGIQIHNADVDMKFTLELKNSDVY